MVVHQETPKRKKKDDYNYEESFFSQSVRISDYIFLPEGMEGFMLLIYFVLIPYGVGLIVIWLFIAGGNMDSFLVLDIFTIIPVWSIGYEVSAGLIMLNIILSGISFHFKRSAYLKKKEAELERQRRLKRSRYDVMKHYENN
jgi:hypothetical protein